MARSLNRVQLIGNLTRDPELRYTPSGTAVCTFGLATNRSWTTDTGEKKEETEFHRIVAWNKLAELCSQFLTKGRKIYVEGRLSTRTWTAQDGQQRNATEIVIDDMILLDSLRRASEEHGSSQATNLSGASGSHRKPKEPSSTSAKPAPVDSKKSESQQNTESVSDDVAPDDIPF